MRYQGQVRRIYVMGGEPGTRWQQSSGYQMKPPHPNPTQNNTREVRYDRPNAGGAGDLVGFLHAGRIATQTRAHLIVGGKKIGSSPICALISFKLVFYPQQDQYILAVKVLTAVKVLRSQLVCWSHFLLYLLYWCTRGNLSSSSIFSRISTFWQSKFGEVAASV